MRNPSYKKLSDDFSTWYYHFTIPPTNKRSTASLTFTVVVCNFGCSDGFKYQYILTHTLINPSSVHLELSFQLASAIVKEQWRLAFLYFRTGVMAVNSKAWCASNPTEAADNIHYHHIENRLVK